MLFLVNVPCWKEPGAPFVLRSISIVILNEAVAQPKDLIEALWIVYGKK